MKNQSVKNQKTQSVMNNTKTQSVMNKQFMVVERNSNYKPKFSEKGFYTSILNNKKKYYIEVDTTNNDVYINDKLEFGFTNNGLSDDDLCLDINLYIAQKYFTI